MPVTATPPVQAKARHSGRSVALKFQARDGYLLGGTFLSAPNPRAAVLVAPATGVPALFYLPFQKALQRRGYSSLAVDYRGIGASLVGSIRTCTARKQDWGQLDLPAALDVLAERAPDLALALVGHSAGGQLVGLMDNVTALHCIIQVSASSGSVHGMSPGYGILCRGLLRIFIPLSCAVLGYAATNSIGWGQDLPKGVALQWARWCSSRGYLERDLGVEIPVHYFDRIRCPILNLAASDDRLATQANVRDLLRLFPNAKVTTRRLEPTRHGLSHIGHIDFFRRSHRVLWGEVFDYLDHQLTPADPDGPSRSCVP